MTQTQLYQPRGRWRVGIAVAAAVLIHFAAIAIANVHRSPQIETAGPTADFRDITVEEPLTPVSDPEVPDALPIPPPINQTFIDESSTPPPIRRHITKSIAPLVKTKGSGSTASLSISSARVFAINA